LQLDGSRLFRFTEMRYRHLALKQILSNAVLIIVEGDRVARQYASVYGIPNDRFIVMASMPEYRPKFAQIAVQPQIINLIHHGNLIPERGIELLMDVAISLGPEYRLTLMGPGTEAYVASLNAKAEKAGNIEIVPPVPYTEIVEKLHGYDLGLIVFGSPHFHHKYMTVPNKFWECLQARVPVLVSPESAMADYVRESGCGIVAEQASLAGYVAAIRSLSREDIRVLKARCEEKAWIHSRDSWLEAYAERVNRAVDAEYLRRAQEAK
ncbi:MAG: glycosyltransferase, partial [Lysobacterales bacterium]